MDGFFHFLQSQPFFVIFGVTALGMALGKLTFRGISFGSVVCIIFVGLIVCIWAYSGYGISLTLPDVLKTIFFNMFIFAIGVKIGPQFFAGLCAAQKETESAVPGIGYPVPLAITTVSLSVVAYFFAIFA